MTEELKIKQVDKSTGKEFFSKDFYSRDEAIKLCQQWNEKYPEFEFVIVEAARLVKRKKRGTTVLR